jgi:peptide deformylase
MAILRQIAQLGQPVLRQETGLIDDPAAPALQALINDMLATMAEASGVGIAAPQVYEPVRLFIVASRPSPQKKQKHETYTKTREEGERERKIGRGKM